MGRSKGDKVAKKFSIEEDVAILSQMKAGVRDHVRILTNIQNNQHLLINLNNVQVKVNGKQEIVYFQHQLDTYAFDGK